MEGYASKVGSAALNQKLSAERAENVTTYLEQQCGIPLTNMLTPGATDTSKHVASDATAEGLAENRRVAVKILQNKGVAGTWLVFTYLSKGTVAFVDTLNNILTRKAQRCAF